MLQVTPLNFQVDEATDFSQTYTVSDDASGVVVILSVDLAYDSVKVTQLSDVTIRLDGQISPFIRSIFYLDEKDISYEVTDFSKLPEQYHAITRYTAPIPSFVDVPVTFNCTVDGIPEQVSVMITVNNNWAVANATFLAALAKESY